LDKVPISQVPEWEKSFLTFIRDQKPEIRDKIMQTRDLDDASIAAIVQAIGEFQAQYASKKGTAATA
jgi:F0F1-type ATP synthase alpha subunit